MKKTILAIAVLFLFIGSQVLFTGNRLSNAPITGIFATNANAHQVSATVDKDTAIVHQVSNAPATSPATRTEMKIPFERLGHFILVRAKINNSKKQYNFVVDTGAITIIDKGVANELKLKQRGPMAKVSTLEIAGYKIENLFCYTGFDLSLFRRFGTPLHGIIGSNLLDRYRVTFDFKSNMLALSNDTTAAAHPSNALVLSFRDHPMNKAPIIKFQINGRTLEGMIDTGQPYSLVAPLEDFAHYKDSGLSAFIRSKGVMIKWPMTKPDHNYMARLNSCKFGNFEAKNLVCVFGELPQLLSMPLIGMDLLTQYSVTIDYPAHEIIMVPYADTHFKDNYFTVGLNLHLAESDSVFVEGVWEGSPADEAGIHVGDKIISFGTNKVTPTNLTELMELMKNDDVKSLELEVMNQKGTRRVMLDKAMLF